MAPRTYSRRTRRSSSSRKGVNSSLLGRAKWATYICRRKLRPISRKRAARSNCSQPTRPSICSTGQRRERSGFFTSPAEVARDRDGHRSERINRTIGGAPSRLASPSYAGNRHRAAVLHAPRRWRRADYRAQRRCDLVCGCRRGSIQSHLRQRTGLAAFAGWPNPVAKLSLSSCV